MKQIKIIGVTLVGLLIIPVLLGTFGDYTKGFNQVIYIILFLLGLFFIVLRKVQLQKNLSVGKDLFFFASVLIVSVGSWYIGMYSYSILNPVCLHGYCKGYEGFGEGIVRLAILVYGTPIVLVIACAIYVLIRKRLSS